MHPPVPVFAPRFLEALDAPGGAVKLRDRLYIERKADAAFKREILKAGTTTTIRAARQSGKSSLLVRGVQQARDGGAQVVMLDLQRLDSDFLASPDIFLRYLAEFILRKLRLDVGAVERVWNSSLGAQDKLSILLEDTVLPAGEGQLVLALDEADRLLQTEFYEDFFALVRSWHNNRAFEEAWNRLNLVLVISTEPYMLIRNVAQSPFNVGLKLYLEDFDAAQVAELNRRHQSPVGEKDLPELQRLLGGQPYLTRKALYTLVSEGISWQELLRVVVDEQGPFGDHLRRYHWLLQEQPELRQALKQVIVQGSCPDEMAVFRLLRAGLVKAAGDVCKCRCELYEQFFRSRI